MKSIRPLLPLLPLLAFSAAQDMDDSELAFEDEAPAKKAEGKPAASTSDTLEEVVVTATRDSFLKRSGTVTTIDQKAMEETGVQDLASMVKYDPNVVIPFDMTTGDGAVAYGGFGSASFNIRGTEGNRIAIEVDGIRQPPEYLSTSFDAGAETGSGGMGRDYFDPSMFHLVEIVKGGASALYSSDAMGGVVSMTTLDPDDMYKDSTWGGLARTQFFSSNDGLAWQLGAGGRTGRLDYMLLYAGRETNETSNNGRISPDPLTMESESWLGKIGYDADDHVFQFTFERYERAMWADMQSALHGPNPMFTIFQKSVENWQDVERTRFSLEWTYRPVGKSIDHIHTMAYWQNATNASRNVSTNPDVDVTGLPPAWGITHVEGRNRRQSIDFETEIYGFNTAAQITLADTPAFKNILQTGVNFSVEEASNSFDRVETRGRVAPPNAVVDTIFSDRISFAPSETYRGSIFFQNEITVQNTWDFTTGLRFDYYEIDADISSQYLDRLKNAVPGVVIPPDILPGEGTGYDNFSISPSLDISYRPTENSRIYTGYAMSVRNPTAEELTMVFDHPSGNFSQLTVPNANLEPETSHAFKLGYKVEAERGKFGVETFYTRFNHFIDNNLPFGVSNGTVLTTTMNRGSAEIYGIEAGGEWNIGADYEKLDGFVVGLNVGYTIGDNRSIDQPINTVEPFRSVGYIGYADPEGRFGSRIIGTFTGAVTRTDDTTMNGKMFHPDSWFTMDLVAWWKPVKGLTLNAGVNNIFDEEYWNWSTVRRGGGHLGLDQFGGQFSSVTDRTTAPGRNFFVSATYQF